MYPDGSGSYLLRRGGAGAFIEWIDWPPTEFALPAGSKCTSSKAEERALLYAIEELLKSPEEIYNKNIIFLLDSADVLKTIEDPKQMDSTGVTNTLKYPLSQISKRTRLQWIPGHC